MNSVKKNENQKDIERYLEEKNVYFLFEELLQSIIINQPKSPLDFLFDKLSQPERKLIFSSKLEISYFFFKIKRFS